MSKDILIIPAKSDDVIFTVLGAYQDTGLLLLQRLYVLLLSDPRIGFRDSDGGQTLLKFLDGGNIPIDSIMDTYLSLGCKTALSMLDPEDRALITSFTGKSIEGKMYCTLKLKDGTTIQGLLNG